jgi:hypothetical protein
MSYLDMPRFYFSGRFFANPSTINNKLANFSPDVKLLPLSASRQSSSVVEEYAGFQYINPYGLHNFCLDGCVITGYQEEDGRIAGQLGRVFSGTPYAKIVDLDPDQQSLTQIFGLSIHLQLSDDSGFRGNVEPTSLFDLWYGRVPSEKGDQMAGGCFQALLPAEKIAWLGDNNPMLRALRERSVTGISIKLMLDAYQGNPVLPDFNYGRVVGVVGPGLPGEPACFPGERRLRPCGSSFGPGYWKLSPEARRVTIDLSNVAPLLKPAGEPIDFGPLHAVIIRDGELTSLHDSPLDYSRAALTSSGGLVDLPVTAEQCSLLLRHPLGIHAEISHGPTPLVLQEHPSLKWINCEPAWVRLVPGEQATVTFHARRAGRPLVGEKLELALTRHPINNRPRTGIEFPDYVTTQEDGTAQVWLMANSPQPLPPRRAIIDSQIYYIGGVNWQAVSDLTRQSGGGALSVLVFNKTAHVAAPTWNDHVGPILSYYARIYPGVMQLLGLYGYHGACANVELLQRCLSLPYEDPMHFPPSRDLSPEKAQMICRWIDLGCPYE